VLSMNSYPQEYVDRSRATVRAHLASWDALDLSEADRAAFEPGYVHQLVLALDNYFPHRARSPEGKDGNPLNEVRMLCGSIRDNDGVLAADPTIKYQPAGSVLGIAIADPIAIDVDGFRRLSEAFFDEIEKRFPQA
jgi:hypothetical protein